MKTLVPHFYMRVAIRIYKAVYSYYKVANLFMQALLGTVGATTNIISFSCFSK